MSRRSLLVRARFQARSSREIPGPACQVPSTCALGVVPACLLAPLLALLLVGSPATAGAQYTSASNTSSLEPIPEKESFDEKIEDARWTFGALEVQPWFGLRDASYVTDQDIRGTETRDETDLTATAGAGLRIYARSSPKLIFTAHALPEYVWWQDLDRKSQWNGRYGAGLFGYFNRLRFELSHRSVEEQDFFSTEVQLLTSTEVARTRGAVEVDLSRGITAFVTARTLERSGNREDDPLFGLLDRTEDRWSAGVRIESAAGHWASVAYEDATQDFDPGARDLSTEEEAIIVGFGFDGGQTSATFRLDFRDVEPKGDSLFQPFDDITGRVDVLWQPRKGFGVRVYGNRYFDYSVTTSQTYLLGTRIGARFEIAPRVGSLQIGAATGEDEYGAALGATPRTDDVSELEAQLRLPVGEIFLLSLYAAYIDYDSIIPEFDRDVTRYGLALELGRVIDRLSLGDGSVDW